MLISNILSNFNYHSRFNRYFNRTEPLNSIFYKLVSPRNFKNRFDKRNFYPIIFDALSEQNKLKLRNLT